MHHGGVSFQSLDHFRFIVDFIQLIFPGSPARTDDDAIAPGILGYVQGLIRRAHEGVRFLRVIREHRDTERGGDVAERAVAIFQIKALYQGSDVLGSAPGSIGRRLGQDQRELFSPIAAGYIASADSQRCVSLGIQMGGNGREDDLDVGVCEAGGCPVLVGQVLGRALKPGPVDVLPISRQDQCRRLLRRAPVLWG